MVQKIQSVLEGSWIKQVGVLLVTVGVVGSLWFGYSTLFERSPNSSPSESSPSVDAQESSASHTDPPNPQGGLPSSQGLDSGNSVEETQNPFAGKEFGPNRSDSIQSPDYQTQVDRFERERTNNKETQTLSEGERERMAKEVREDILSSGASSPEVAELLRNHPHTDTNQGEENPKNTSHSPTSHLSDGSENEDLSELVQCGQERCILYWFKLVEGREFTKRIRQVAVSLLVHPMVHIRWRAYELLSESLTGEELIKELIQRKAKAQTDRIRQNLDRFISLTEQQQKEE